MGQKMYLEKESFPNLRKETEIQRPEVQRPKRQSSRGVPLRLQAGLPADASQQRDGVTVLKGKNVPEKTPSSQAVIQSRRTEKQLPKQKL